MHRVRTLKVFLWLYLASPWVAHASFIEATMGTAVVNDATAAYHNPAALTLVQKNQLVALGSIAQSRTKFQGQVSTRGIGLRGSASSQSQFYLPSFYLALPVNDTVVTGLAVVSNFFNNDVEKQSILRYAQSGNSVQSIDFVPALGIRLKPWLALGASFNLSTAHFLLTPISGFPSLNIPDSQSRNEAFAQSIGGDVGFLLRPHKKVLVGFNYRSNNKYLFEGKSVLESIPRVVSHRYQFTFWTPARAIVSFSYAATQKIGLIGTVNRIYWSVFKNSDINGIATQTGGMPLIIAHARVPYYLRDTWLLTVGGQYRWNDKTVLRAALSFNQSPGNGNYQIITGNSWILGSSFGYKITKSLSLDASYAHAFFNKADIHTQGLLPISGVNQSSRDAVSLKLTYSSL